jgi:hypothetical protein
MKIILLFVILLMITSCGKIKRNTVKTETNTELTVIDSEAEQIVTTEKVDTLIVLQPDTTDWKIRISLPEDTSTLFFESEKQVIEIKYTEKTKTLNVRGIVKQVTVPVQIEKTTTENRVSDSKVVFKENTVEKNKELIKTKPLIPWWSWLIVIVLAAAYVYMKVVL